ncbi:MAG: hypothetical protein WCH34_12965 [Bacteroidota bacterium]
MKNKSFQLILAFVLCLITLQAKPQAAGNWMMNQSKANSYDDYNLESGAYAKRGAKVADPYGSYPTYYQAAISDSVIVIETNLMMNVKADEYVAIFGISQVSDSIEAGHQLINSRINNFTTAIAKLGVLPKDVFVDFISQVPIFEIEVEKKIFSKTYNEVPKGFELKKNIHVRYSDNKIVDALLIEAAKKEIYDIVKVDYIIKDNDEVYDTLRRASVDLMNKKLKEFKKLGLNIIPMYQTLNEDINTTYPIERYSSYNTFSAASMAGIKSSSLTKYSLRNSQSSLYYNKVAYKNFDIVINPSILEPVVQYTYHLSMKYVLKKN